MSNDKKKFWPRYSSGAPMGYLTIPVMLAYFAGSLSTGRSSKSGEDVRNLINQNTPDAVTIEKMNIALPPELVSTDSENIVDLSSVDQIAQKMGIQLNGDPQQVLFNLTVRAPDVGSEPKKLPVTVEAALQMSKFINAMEGGFVSKATASQGSEQRR